MDEPRFDVGVVDFRVGILGGARNTETYSLRRFDNHGLFPCELPPAHYAVMRYGEFHGRFFRSAYLISESSHIFFRSLTNRYR